MFTIRYLIQHLAQSLHRVQQQIALPHNSLVLCVLQRRPIGLYNSVHLVDRTVESATCDEPRELTKKSRQTSEVNWPDEDALVDKIYANTESPAQTFQRETPVRFQQLAVC